MKLKKITLFLGLTLILCPFITGCTNEKEKINQEVKKDEKEIIKPVTQDNLIFRNTSVEVTDEGSTVITEIENISEKATIINSITLSLKDEKGNVIKILSSYVGDELKAKETVATVAKTATKLKNVKSIDYTVQ